jgi:hypothetical protein
VRRYADAHVANGRSSFPADAVPGGTHVMAFIPADEIVNLLKKQLGLDENYFTVLRIWEKEIRPFACNAELSGFSKGRLVVEVASSVHFQELTLRKRELINKLNQYFGARKVVKDIKVQLKK